MYCGSRSADWKEVIKTEHLAYASTSSTQTTFKHFFQENIIDNHFNYCKCIKCMNYSSLVSSINANKTKSI